MFRGESKNLFILEGGQRSGDGIPCRDFPSVNAVSSHWTPRDAKEYGPTRAPSED